METSTEINCKEIFRNAYENRYTWKNDFNGYQGKCTFRFFVFNKRIHFFNFVSSL